MEKLILDYIWNALRGMCCWHRAHACQKEGSQERQGLSEREKCSRGVRPCNSDRVRYSEGCERSWIYCNSRKLVPLILPDEIPVPCMVPHLS